MVVCAVFCGNRGYGIFLPCLRQILRNMASLSNTSHGHKVSHFDWNFLSLLPVGLESVEGVFVLPDEPSNVSVTSLLLLLFADSVLTFRLNKNLKLFFGLENQI